MIILFTSHFFFGWWSTEQAKEVRKWETKANRAVPAHFNLLSTHLPCCCHFSREGEQRLWLRAWKDICFHTLGVTHTNKNLSNRLSGLSNRLSVTGIRATLNTQILIPSHDQFHFTNLEKSDWWWIIFFLPVSLISIWGF